MKQDYLTWRFRFFWLAVFAIAMGFLEGIVVVYIRELFYPEGFGFPLRLMSPDLVAIEWIREIATLVMLATVGILTGKNNLQRLFYALFAFGIWDISYYVALKLLIGWPVSLLTWDLLFLIPVSWLGPVLAPVINSLTMIAMAFVIIGREERGFTVKVKAVEWALIIGGALVILYTYFIDYSRLIFRSGVLSGGSTGEEQARLNDMITNYVPENYGWILFTAGEVMIIAATILIMIKTNKKIMKQFISLTTIMAALFAISACSGNRNMNTGNDDPWLWLEEIEGEKSLAWVTEQNRLSEAAFAGQPLFTELSSRFLEVLNDKERIIYPNIVGDYVYDLWQDDTNERGLWRRMTRDDFLNGQNDWETVIDLDKLSAEENRIWVFHGASWLGPGNRYCLLSLSDGGKDESVVREFDATSKSFVEGGFSIGESKGSAAWIDRDNILVATNYGGGTMTTSGYPRIVKLWKRGSDPGAAEEIMATDTTNMGIFLNDAYINGKQYTFINESRGFYENKMFLYTSDGPKEIKIPSDAETKGLFGGNLLIELQSDWTTGDKTFARGTLVSFDLDSYIDGKVSVRTIYKPDERSSCVSLLTTKDFVVVASLENVVSKLTTYRFDGEKWSGEPVDVPEFGTVSLITGDDLSDDWFFSFSNPVTPSALFYGNGNEIKAIKKQKAYFDASGLVVNQYEAVSKDGTVIPYFIVHRKDMVFDGKNPTLIYGYGGFNSSMLPTYNSVTGIGWMEKGGVYVIANIRGGGEFGPAWHQSALKEKRQNAYDDFFAVAEDIIKKKISSPEWMGAFGWSNGGLLAGVAVTQRPDLYNAIVIGAPLLDMKRYSKMLAGASWMDEYGDPDKPEDWAYIGKYSPYQNVSSRKKYPEPLFMTSTKDDRVHPGHARKMAAKMLDMGHPLYYHETIEGGHGAASTNRQKAEMWALIYTYLNRKLMSGS